MSTLTVSPRKRAGSRTTQNHHPVSIADPISTLNSLNTNNTKTAARGNNNNRNSTLDNPAAAKNDNGTAKETTGTNTKHNQTKRSGTPPQNTGSETHTQNNTQHTANSTTSQAQLPKLSKMIYVLKLVSPEQPNEFLKVLNIPHAPQTLKIGRQNTPKTSNKITDGFFDSRVLSRNHAELFVKNNELHIRDLKSSNGTFINDTKLDPYDDYKLNINDKIDLGTTLESQMAHRKITCIVREFQQISLKSFQDLVDEIVNKDEMINKKLELFNSTFDALLFGEIVDDVVIGGDASNDDLLSLIEGTTSKTNNKTKSKKGSTNKVSSGEFKQGLDLKSQDPQEMIKKLIVAVNNEYIQQQRLKEMNNFLKNYNNSVAGYESTSIFRIYDKLLRSSQSSISVQNDEDKYHKMEAQVKRFQNELETVRRHLSTAQSKEKEMAMTESENIQLKNSIQSTTKELENLKLELQSKNEKFIELESKLKESELKLSAQLESASPSPSPEEQENTEQDSECNLIVNETVDKETPTVEQNTNNANDDTKVVREVSSAILRYGGLAVVSFVFVWYVRPTITGV